MGDRGIYVCRVENAAGSDQDWAVVEVERKTYNINHIYITLEKVQCRQKCCVDK